MKQSVSLYGSARYWGRRYEAAAADTESPAEALSREEWYLGFAAFKAPLLELCGAEGAAAPPGRCLLLGTGLSLLAEEVADAGFGARGGVDAVDFAPEAVEFMRRREERRREAAGGAGGCTRVAYEEMDVRRLSYADGSFESVVDKATLDSLANNDDAEADVAAMLREAHRVLMPGGAYALLSYDDRSELLLRQSLGWELVGGAPREVRKNKAQFWLHVMRKAGGDMELPQRVSLPQ